MMVLSFIQNFLVVVLFPEALGTAESVEEIARESLVKVTGVQNPGQAVSILLRGSNKLVLDEADRSLHDAFCVVRCLVKKRALLPGGGAPEMEVAVKLRESRFLKTGLFNKEKAYLAYADAMEFIPYTLAGNAGLSPIETGIELRRQHANGNEDFGINVRKGAVTNIKEENVLQPLLVTSFAIKQASETVRSILKIDDIKNSDSTIGHEMVYGFGYVLVGLGLSTVISLFLTWSTVSTEQCIVISVYSFWVEL